MSKALALFSAIGLEIEYMLVADKTLEIKPIADRLIQAMVGDIQRRGEFEGVGFSNELALHQIELKTATPQTTLNGLDETFHRAIRGINTRLATYGAHILPTGMHPRVPVGADIARWPHQDRIIYDTYHQIFNCNQPGWTNAQSLQINLPFANDEEFSRLHNAIRVLLPILPALTASTPIVASQKGRYLSSRAYYYERNQRRLPSTIGQLIPEYCTSPLEYDIKILQPMYAEIAAFENSEILAHEWLNARAAIPRFDRQAVEVRLTDSQESPVADIAIAAAIQAGLQAIIMKTEAYLQQPLKSESLYEIYRQVMVEGYAATLPVSYVTQLGMAPNKRTVRHMWEALLSEGIRDIEHRYQIIMEHRLSNGCLAEAILRAIKRPTYESITTCYHALAHCTATNDYFHA